MRHQKNRIFLFLKLSFCGCLIIYCNHGYSQNQFYQQLKKDINSLSINSSNIQFISIDSILSDKKGPLTEVENGFSKMKEVLVSNKYYLLKIGYYVKDSNGIKDVLVVFNKLKEYLKNITNNNITKIDANCQSYLAVIDQASKYEDRTKTKVGNSIYFLIYKSKTKVQKLNPKKECYF